MMNVQSKYFIEAADYWLRKNLVMSTAHKLSSWRVYEHYDRHFIVVILADMKSLLLLHHLY
jgi:hypothetical protein